jgi:hypothetical protein
LNIETGVFSNYSKQHGLNNIEYTSGACYKTKNGELFLVVATV